MKRIIQLLTIGAITAQSYAQLAPVPTSWDCTDVGNLPTGYFIGPVSFPPSNYTQLGINNGSSVKLNGDDQYVQIELAAEAGRLTYYLRGTNPPSTPTAPWQGTLDVQISDDGIVWSSTRTFNNGELDINGNVMYADTLLSTTRYVRFYYTDKVSGYNTSLDEISISTPLPKPEAEINAVYSGDTVFSAGNIYVAENVGSTNSFQIVIENHGTDSTLDLSSVVSSNSTEFTVTSFDASIAANGTGNINIDFSPTAAGTRTSTLTIANNDANENPYTLNLIGYGNGFATEPSTPTIATSSVTTYRYTATITPNSPLNDEGYLVLFKKGSAPSTNPTDGVIYTPGDMIGDAKVAYAGTDLTYLSKETRANQTHHLAVYAYSGVGQYTKYTSVAGTHAVTMPNSMQSPSYYSTIQTSSSTFIADLHALINPHTRVFYGDYDDTYIDNFASRDTTNGQKVVTCRYTSDQYVYDEPFGFSYITREHSYPQSWMPTWAQLSTTDFENTPEYADYHNLFPVNQNQANGQRSNFPLGVVVNVTDSYLDGKKGTDVNGNTVYEPRDDHKGDAARAIFYQAVTYHSVSGNDWSLPNPISLFVPYGQDQDVLKQWHWNDPVSDYEKSRNDYIESLQGNRNPFIDSMHYACYIDFTTMTRVETTAPCTTTPVSIDENVNAISVDLYPNPSSSEINLAYSLDNSENTTIWIVNQLGQTIKSIQVGEAKDVSKSIAIKDLKKGTYQLVIKGDRTNIVRQFTKI